MRKVIEKWPNHKEFEGDTIILGDIIENVKTTKQRKPRLTLEKFAEEVRNGFVMLENRINMVESKLEGKIDAINDRLNRARIDTLSERIEILEHKINDRLNRAGIPQ